MDGNHRLISRREFLETTAKATAAASLLGAAAVRSAQPNKQRVALVGTGIRGSNMWGKELLAEVGDRVELVGLCDINHKRVEVCKSHIGLALPTFTKLDEMLEQTRPETLIVCTKDSTHHEQIIRGLEFGCNIITEKPMTTDEKKCRAILDAEKKTGRKITVTFNYRYMPTAQKVKELLMANAIGMITSIDFHWYLDVYHGADYFRRWHAYKENSGTLFVHKSTHHFDMINWFLEADPVQVSAFGSLRKYGRNGAFRHRHCRGCTFKDRCEFYWDITKKPELVKLYVDCESEDGYLRDACVFREDIDIYDTMVANVSYSNGAMMSYSLNAFMPYEGYHLAFNGTHGRLEVRNYERQPWQVAKPSEIRLTKNFGGTELIESTQAEGGHGDADPMLQKMLFNPEMPDPYKQRADSRAGAMSILTGIAAVKSVERRKPVRISDLIKL
ncbi:Gfo/Idh/MocA family oxidoreductase [bacterium]|nr:Gfo/Idh/MocA family oxidoreductase [bacterium]